MKASPICPEKSYGMLQCAVSSSIFEKVAEQVLCVGYAVVNADYTANQLNTLSEEFDTIHESYIKRHGAIYLKEIDEHNTIRAPLAQGSELFLELAFNKNLLAVITKLIDGNFILNQQNGIINPPQQSYNQAAWHRDLPYQHFLSSSPLAINALFCLDDFTTENGATFVLPASHKMSAFPSPDYVKQNAMQIVAKAGSFIVLDGMLFHAGGFNTTTSHRRAVNHLYNIPFFKQQIVIPRNMSEADLSAEQRQMLDYRSADGHESIESYLKSRAARLQSK